MNTVHQCKSLEWCSLLLDIHNLIKKILGALWRLAHHFIVMSFNPVSFYNVIQTPGAFFEPQSAGVDNCLGF